MTRPDSPSLIALCVVSALSGVSAQTPAWQPSPGHTQVPIWPSTKPAGPDSESLATAPGMVAGRPWQYISNVARPTLTVFSPTGKNTGAAVVVFPGGGYQILAIDLEGTEVCDWLTANGITCILLKYRVPNAGPSWNQSCGCDVHTRSSRPLEDAQRAVSLVRFHAAEWHVDPHKIGVLGFSAGGHLVAAVSTRFASRVYAAVDAADRESCRPDFAVALYPGHLLNHTKGKFNPDLPVSPTTPPTFILQAENDSVDGVTNSLTYYTALKDAGVPTELHLFPSGGHAFGLRHTALPITDWPRLVETWLQSIGMTSP